MNEEMIEAAEERRPEEPESAPASVDEPEQRRLPTPLPEEPTRLALLEAIVYVAEEPLTPQQIAEVLEWPVETVRADLAKLVEASRASSRGLEIRQVAGGFKMFTKAEHHDEVRRFVKALRPKLKLSLPALETLSVIAYKQPITLPEIQAIRGVNAGGVLHTLLKHRLVATAGRKKVVGKPMLYKTTREFLVQFGLADLSELPNLKELEELSRAALGDEDGEEPAAPDGQAPLDLDEPASADAESNDEPDGGEDETERAAAQEPAN